MRKRKEIAIIACLSIAFVSLPIATRAGDDVSFILEEKHDILGEASEYGYIPIKKAILNQKDLETGRRRQSARATSIPSSYDAREEGLLSEIQNQGELSNCWSYAAMGVSEANIRKKGYEVTPDLSEYHLSYSVYNKTLDPMGLTLGDNCRVKEMNNNMYLWGGNDYMTISTLSRWQGVLEEEDAPLTELFSAYKNKIPAILPEEILNKDSYHLQNAEFIYITQSNMDLIKEKIMQYGSGTISYYSKEESGYNKFSNTGSNDYTAYYCNDTTKTANHEVMVVGWDDNYSVNHFNTFCRPSKPGAWLIRNSWGKYNEMNGYFWLSYEDAMLNPTYCEDAEIVFYDLETSDRYDHNYQYDGGLPFSYIRGCKSAANVFTSQNSEKLQAVSFYTQERNVNFKVNIYKLKDASKPTTGTKLGETIIGKCEERGYHTIDFAEMGVNDIILEKGALFSVVLSMSDSNGEDVYYTYETELGYSELEENISGGINQSLVFNGVEWSDFAQIPDGNGKKYDCNLCIKAFTSDMTEGMPTSTGTPDMLNTPTATTLPVVTTTPTLSPTPTPTEAVVPTSAHELLKPTTEPASIVPPASTDKTSVTSATTKQLPIVKKLKFSVKSKKVKAGKKLVLSNYLKIVKNRVGKPKLIYEFTKKKYKKYASLTKKGILRAKKKGRRKTLYVRVRALDGSGKAAKIKIKIS